MKLTILLVIYCSISILALCILFGPLRKVISPKEKKNKATLAIIIVPFVMWMFPLVGALVRDGNINYFFQKWGNTFLGYLLYFFGILLFIVIIRGIVYLFSRKPAGRGFWGTVLALLLALTVGLNIYGSIHAHDVHVTNYIMDKEKLGLEEELKIVLLADLHIGVNSNEKLYEDMVKRVNEQNPDLVLIAGDIVTSAFGAIKDEERCADILRGMKPRIGTYVVYGNHDVDEPLLGGFTIGEAQDANRHPHMDDFLISCGWELLTDEVVNVPKLGRLVIAGRRDEKRPGDGVKVRATLDELLKDVPKEAPVILLEHEPSELQNMDKYGVDLVVSGHTHDGQIFPGNVITRIMSDQAYGMKEWGGTTAVVTSGVGFYGPPLRVGTISEVVVIDCR